MSRDKPTRELVFEYLDYEPNAGIFRWKKRPLSRSNFTARIRPGQIAGYIRKGDHDKRGRRYINLLRRSYQSADLAWLLMTGDWPPTLVDHRNNNSSDDRWENLRLATRSQNGANAGALHSSNTSGYRGVYYRGPGVRRKPWIVYIQRRYIGVFDTAIEAARAYDRAAGELYGEFAYRNFPLIKRPRG